MEQKFPCELKHAGKIQERAKKLTLSKGEWITLRLLSRFLSHRVCELSSEVINPQDICPRNLCIDTRGMFVKRIKSNYDYGLSDVNMDLRDYIAISRDVLVEIFGNLWRKALPATELSYYFRLIADSCPNFDQK